MFLIRVSSRFSFRLHSLLVELNNLRVLSCSDQHGVLTIWAGIRVSHLLNPVCIPEGVKRMLGTRIGGTYICDHGGFTVASQRIFEDSGKQ